jgi:hypothetical protein
VNLRPKHFPILLLGATAGAVIGGLLTFLLPPGTFPEAERAAGRHGAGLLLGAVAGAAVTVLVILYWSVRDPASAPSSNFTSINGIGSTLIGKRDPAPDSSYFATEWFIVFFLPVFPICRYHVIPLGAGSYQILSKGPPKASEVVRIYVIEIIAIVLVGGTALYLKCTFA